jgi:hypothetical protein
VLVEGVPKFWVKMRGRITHGSHLTDIHLSRMTIFRSRELTALLRRIAVELRRRNQDERTDQISMVAEAVEKTGALEQAQSGGKEP